MFWGVRTRVGPAWTGRGRPTAGSFTKRLAEDWLRDTLDAARRGTLPGAVRTGVTFDDAAAEWLRYGCTIPLYQWPSVVQATARLHNFEPNPTLATDSWNAADWWLS